jgi:hypothetical protein
MPTARATWRAQRNTHQPCRFDENESPSFAKKKARIAVSSSWSSSSAVAASSSPSSSATAPQRAGEEGGQTERREVGRGEILGRGWRERRIRATPSPTPSAQHLAAPGPRDNGEGSRGEIVRDAARSFPNGGELSLSLSIPHLLCSLPIHIL